MRSASLIRRRGAAMARVCPLIVAALVALGCGGKPPFELVEINGRVLLSDESPIVCPRLEIVFIPEVGEPDSSGVGPRAARAIVNVADGTFRDLTTWSAGDGVVAGRHKVLVIARDELGLPHPAVSPKYGSPRSTRLGVEVVDGAPPLTFLVERDKERSR